MQLDLSSKAYHERKDEVRASLLAGDRVVDAKISLFRFKAVSRYEDCRFVLTDPRFVRERGRAIGRPGAGVMPFPLPRGVQALAKSMILEDDPDHRRHRSLVNRAFTARALVDWQPLVEEACEDRLAAIDGSPGAGFDALADYAHDIPRRVIAALLGIAHEEIEAFDRSLRTLTKGFSGFGIVRTLLFDLRSATGFVRDLIARKRREPGDDLMTALIEAEEEGSRLSEDELIAMVFLLVVAGFETTVNAIGNGVVTLLAHPEALSRLRSGAVGWETGTDELIRFQGPIQGTKLQYASEDLEIAGHPIARGQAVMPLLHVANRDPAVFDEPDLFDPARNPNPHLGFGFGAHFCLGRQLALMETRIALERLFGRLPDLALRQPAETLERVSAPGWHRYARVPVIAAG